MLRGALTKRAEWRLDLPLYPTPISPNRDPRTAARNAPHRAAILRASHSPLSPRRLRSGEFSAPLGASLYLQSGDLHFRPQVRVGVCAWPVGAARTFCSRAKLTGKNTGKNLVSRSPAASEGARNPYVAGVCEIFEVARTLQMAGTEIAITGKRFSNNRESAITAFPVFLRVAKRRFCPVDGAPEGAQGPAMPAAPMTRAS